MDKIPSLREMLQKKGWTREEIEQAISIIESEEKKRKHLEFKKSANRFLYWNSILILITFNIFIAIVLIPFLLVLKGLVLYAVVGTFALVFGLIFNFLVIDLEYIEKKHHVFAAILIPLAAFVNIFVVATISNTAVKILNLHTYNSPLTASLVYVLVFILPYLLSGAKKGWRD